MKPLSIYDCFIPECNLDTALIEVLLSTSNSVNHSKGNSGVVGKMKEKLSDSFALGIIDRDKIVVKGLEEFDQINRLSKECLKLFSHPSREHYIIQICPAIERWLLKECSKGGIIPSDLKYGLPDNVKKMADLKHKTQRGDIRFKRLFNDMLANESCDEIRELKRWLLFFRENNYKSNIDLL
jgi:hypothetical protein